MADPPKEYITRNYDAVDQHILEIGKRERVITQKMRIENLASLGLPLILFALAVAIVIISIGISIWLIKTEKTVEVDRIVEVAKIVEVPTIVEIEKIIQVPTYPEFDKSALTPNPKNPATIVTKSENKKVGKCNQAYSNGANEPEQYTVNITDNFSGTYEYYYEHFTVKDRATLIFNGNTIFDTGCTSGSKKVALPMINSGGELKIIVQPKCVPNSGDTQWNFRLSCISN